MLKILQEVDAGRHDDRHHQVSFFHKLFSQAQNGILFVMSVRNVVAFPATVESVPTKKRPNCPAAWKCFFSRDVVRDLP